MKLNHSILCTCVRLDYEIVNRNLVPPKSLSLSSHITTERNIACSKPTGKFLRRRLILEIFFQVCDFGGSFLCFSSLT
ncbi:hypothetical protein Csa_000622 [Cucumis sativus]|uniref:Uncharacterized protein n=1 Tax=Cucumis sativus TaxID=3659 RepID=A0A0A0KNV0_CUCSA|nr:hypothetical protein Csa_000622 [Cucumis sativus]